MKKPQNDVFWGFMAERERFELSSGYKPEHDFQSCALDQLSHLSIKNIKMYYANARRKTF